MQSLGGHFIESGFLGQFVGDGKLSHREFMAVMKNWKLRGFKVSSGYIVQYNKLIDAILFYYNIDQNLMHSTKSTKFQWTYICCKMLTAGLLCQTFVYNNRRYTLCTH